MEPQRGQKPTLVARGDEQLKGKNYEELEIASVGH